MPQSPGVERVRLRKDLPELWLRRGQVGVVRGVWRRPTAYDVEFAGDGPNGVIHALVFGEYVEAEGPPAAADDSGAEDGAAEAGAGPEPAPGRADWHPALPPLLRGRSRRAIAGRRDQGTTSPNLSPWFFSESPDGWADPAAPPPPAGDA